MGKFNSNSISSSENVPLKRLSRGQRKRTKKRANLLAKKEFVQLLTKKTKKRKRDKIDGKFQVSDVKKVLEEEIKRKICEAEKQVQRPGVGNKRNKGQSKKSKKTVLREELDLFKQVSNHPAFQQMGISAIKKHLENTVHQQSEE